MIFITGATGLVGSFVAKRLLDEGLQVRCLKRSNSDTSLLKGYEHRIHWVEGDVMDVVQLDKNLEGVHTIIHAAAVVSFVPAQKEQMFEINVNGTANLVNAALRKNIQRFVHVSSIAALGRKLLSERIDENAKWEESPNNSAYASSKYLAELEVWRGIEEGLQASIVNPSIILGIGDVKKSSTKLFNYILKGNRFYPQGTINYVDVRDVADAIYRLAISNTVGERYILNGGKISYKDFFGKIAQELGKKPPTIPVSKLLAEIGWRASVLYALLTGTEPTLTKETARISAGDYIYVNTKAIEQLGVQFTTLEDSVRWVCASMKATTAQSK